MNTSKKVFPLKNKGALRNLILLAVVFVPTFLIVAAIKKDWGDPVFYACVFYTFAVTIFFIAQLFGFVLSQTHYSESIEEAKFRILALEETEWPGYDSQKN